MQCWQHLAGGPNTRQHISLAKNCRTNPLKAPKQGKFLCAHVPMATTLLPAGKTTGCLCPACQPTNGYVSEESNANTLGHSCPEKESLHTQFMHAQECCNTLALFKAAEVQLPLLRKPGMKCRPDGGLTPNHTKVKNMHMRNCAVRSEHTRPSIVTLETHMSTHQTILRRDFNKPLNESPDETQTTWTGECTQ